MNTRRITNRLAELSALHHKFESFEDTLRHIREFGVGIISVAEDERALGWTYSTGLYDTYGQPEIILTGSPPKLAKFIINEMGRRYSSGVTAQEDIPTQDLIGNDLRCIFKPVDKVWVNRLMLRTLWFYGNDNFPSLQCICPDFEGLFPWEKGFDERWKSRQALLYPGAPRGKAETRLWNVSGSEGSAQ